MDGHRRRRHLPTEELDRAANDDYDIPKDGHGRAPLPRRRGGVRVSLMIHIHTRRVGVGFSFIWLD